MHTLLYAGALLTLTGCALSPERAEEKLARAVERVVARDPLIHNAVLHVSSAPLGLHGTWAAGTAQATTDAPMTAETPFLSASVGKLFTAATVLALAERGTFSLDDDLTVWLDADLIADLPVQGGTAALSGVTLRRLLSHRSGLPDYFSDPTADGAPNLAALLTEAPDQVWTPEALLRYTAAHFAPAGRPGEGFHYADTNYILLGLVIEAATGRPFHSVVRAEVMAPLGLVNTWYYTHEAAPDTAVLLPSADAWVGDQNVAGTGALSLDWAGGGLVTTTADLAALLRGLQAGQPVALDQLQAEWSEDTFSPGIDYAYGLWRVQPHELSWLLSGPELLGASGATGAFAYLALEYDAVITGTFNQLQYEEEHLVFLVTKVLPILDRIRPSEDGAAGE